MVTPSARAHWQAMSLIPPAAVWKRIVARFELADLAEKVLDGEPLHQRRRDAIGDTVGELDQLVGRHHAHFAARAKRPLQ
jgi:hypothetical protein